MKDKNGKELVVGARVAVLKGGELRLGTLEWTREVVVNGPARMPRRSPMARERVGVALDRHPRTPEDTAGKWAKVYAERLNRWEGRPSDGNILVLGG